MSSSSDGPEKEGNLLCKNFQVNVDVGNDQLCVPHLGRDGILFQMRFPGDSGLREKYIDCELRWVNHLMELDDGPFVLW